MKWSPIIILVLLPLPAFAQQQRNLPPAVAKQLEEQLNEKKPLAEVKFPEPVPFRNKAGQVMGWKVSIPGGRPLATPAVVDGKVFLGGGFGSHEFYAFDAATGKKLWHYQTGRRRPDRRRRRRRLRRLQHRVAASWKSSPWTASRSGRNGWAIRS